MTNICQKPEVGRNLTCFRNLPTKQNQKVQCNWREVNRGERYSLDKVVRGWGQVGFYPEDSEKAEVQQRSDTLRLISMAAV